MSSSTGYFYLIHFSQPIAPGKHTTQHYAGWEQFEGTRIREHKRGQGSRLCQVAVERGIAFDVVLRVPGDRHFERTMKNRKNLSFLCPICQEEKRRKRLEEQRRRRQAKRFYAVAVEQVVCYWYLCAIISCALKAAQARAI